MHRCVLNLGERNEKDLLFCLVATIVTACESSPPSNWTNSAEIPTYVEVKYNAKKKLTTYKGPDFKKGAGSDLYLYAWKVDGTDEATYQIYYSFSYDSPFTRSYQSAEDMDGNRLSVTKIWSSIPCIDCYIEAVGINVSKEYLEERQSRGILITLQPSVGPTLPVFLPGKYVDAFVRVANGPADTE